MVTIKNEELKNILNKPGYEVYFENLELETELNENFNLLFVRPFLNRLSMSSTSKEPFNHYLDSILEKTDKLSQLSNQDFTNSNMVELLKILNVSDSLKYMFSEGLQKQVLEIEEVYDEFLKLIQIKFPEIDFQKRYPFTEDMKKFCNTYLAKPLAPFAEVMIMHQKYLTKTFDLYKDHLINKKDMQSSYLISKLAGVFLGGIVGSVAVTALFEGFQTQGTRKFSEALAMSHQTWYQIQTANLIDTIVSNYQPRVHHLYLTLVGGLLLNIKKDLKVLGFELLEYNVPGNSLEITLHDEGEEVFKVYIENTLNKILEIKDIVNVINTLSKYPCLQSLTDKSGNLYLEKLIVKYLLIVSIEIKKSPDTCHFVELLPAINLRDIKDDGDFSFLQNDEDKTIGGFPFLKTNEYKETYNLLESAFLDFPEYMHSIFEAIVDKYNIYTWGDKNQITKVLDSNPLSEIFMLSNIITKKKTSYYIENVNDFNKAVLTPFVEKRQDSNSGLYLKDKSLFNNTKESFLNKFKIRITARRKLEAAILNLDYFSTKELLMSGIQLKEFNVPIEILQLEHRGYFEMLARYLNKMKVTADESILLEIIENQDNEALRILLSLGLDPFTPVEDSYLLGKVTIFGDSLLNLFIYEHCNNNFIEYDKSLKKLSTSYLTPYYFIFASGKTYINDVYPKLLSIISLDKVDKELTLASSSLPSKLLWEMYEVIDSDELFNYTKNIEGNFYNILCATNHYAFFNELHEKHPNLLKDKINNKYILREISELGNIDLAEHFIEKFEIYKIGDISYEDLETIVFTELNENYLRILLYLVDGIEEAFQEIKIQADNENQMIASKLLERVLDRVQK